MLCAELDSSTRRVPYTVLVSWGVEKCAVVTEREREGLQKENATLRMRQKESALGTAKAMIILRGIGSCRVLWHAGTSRFI